jgi:hypothetical protein
VSQWWSRSHAIAFDSLSRRWWVSRRSVFHVTKTPFSDGFAA